MGDYHNLYLKTDVLLLTDLSEQVRKTCLQQHKVDLYHYFNGSRLSWNAMLKMTGVVLNLMTFIDLYQFNKKGMRKEISYEVQRYCHF